MNNSARSLTINIGPIVIITVVVTVIITIVVISCLIKGFFAEHKWLAIAFIIFIWFLYKIAMRLTISKENGYYTRVKVNDTYLYTVRYPDHTVAIFNTKAKAIQAIERFGEKNKSESASY